MEAAYPMSRASGRAARAAACAGRSSTRAPAALRDDEAVAGGVEGPRARARQGAHLGEATTISRVMADSAPHTRAMSHCPVAIRSRARPSAVVPEAQAVEVERAGPVVPKRSAMLAHAMLIR